MSTGGVKEFVLAKVYAAAMLRLSQAAKLAEGLDEELRNFAAFIEKDAAFATFLESPTVDGNTRKLTLEKLLRGKYSDLLVDTLQVLNRNERSGLIREVAAAYHELLEEATGRVEVQVRSASALNDVLRGQLRETLAKTTGKQVDLVERIDESLIGGLVVQIGDAKYDNSVQRKLHTVGALLMERASREIHRGQAAMTG